MTFTYKIKLMSSIQSKIIIMPRILCATLLIVAFLVAGTSNLLAYISPQEAQDFKQAFRAATAEDWDKAYQLAKGVRDPVAAEIIHWLELRSGVNQWEAYWQFVKQTDVWPGLKILRKTGESALTGQENPYQVIEYFESYYPQTGMGALHYARALKKVGKTKEAERTIRNAFLSLPFTQDAFAQVMSEFPQSTKALITVRMDNLIWLDRLDQAKMLRPYLSNQYKALFDARVALKSDGQRVDSLIRSVPQSLKDTSGLNFDRVIWRFNNEAIERGIDLFLEKSEVGRELEKPAFWSNRRVRLAHSLTRDKRYVEAYQLAAGHNLTKNGVLQPLKWLSDADQGSWVKTQRNNYLELEWLAGFIALRKLNEPNKALSHFYNYYLEVNEPTTQNASYSIIRQGKAGYWLGLTHERLGNLQDAIIAYRHGSKYQTSFYGQLAAQKINAPLSNLITRKEPVNQAKINALRNDKIVRASLILDDSGIPSFGAWFLSHKAEYVDRAGIVALARIAGSEFSALKVAKQGAVQGDLVVEFLYPLTSESNSKYSVSPAMATSIIRQESEFRPNAVSSKGAMGLMQVLPSTGKPIAAEYGINWSTKNILLDREHNLRIGTAYLQGLLDEFDNSLPLAFASYNAGPGRVAGWLGKLGDPRSPNVNEIDWIEHLPYEETRNYVMRVIETYKVYRVILGERSTLN